ncbi:MAG: beta-N-acetylhexosaminidase [Dysgonamonadaceae bacterium]|jgi:hexosaminidase|nr:beta-N-acetylhexosaminidase [Dysgonamonadaceae bacterium]
MRTLFISALIALCTATVSAQKQSVDVPNIIPEPVSLSVGSGRFVLPDNVLIAAPSKNEETAFTVDFLKEKLSVATGKHVRADAKASNACIALSLNKKYDAKIGDEGYALSVTPTKITLTANKPAGLFYGVQTLLQLFPPEIESKEKAENAAWEIPVVEIVDYPRVGWRGLMFDTARHFFTVNEVKQYIDTMVRYKYNMFHWHLSDDEGWRIEITSLPKLTEIGAWRVEKIGTFNYFSNPLPDEPKTYGGFYTHDDVREIVRYAKERFVNVMPEIDVPAHSLAAIASYPELSCTPGAEKYNVRAGEPIMDWNFSPPRAFVDNTLCPANEKVYEFMDKVMTEIAQLFPFEYIHVGGDEAPHNFWEQSPQVQALMKRERLTTYPQVQSYFEKRLEKIIRAKGKKMMGWDEILEGGITPTTALMSWRGEKHGIEASNSGHYVVMSPSNFVYIDLMQGDASTEPPVYNSLRLSRTYQFNPLPEGANAKYILGGQANLWTEQIYNLRQAQYMTWPRAFAVAESVWSPLEKKDWKRFIEKTENHFKRFDFAEIKYSPAMYDPIVSVSKTDDKYYVTLTPEIEGLDIYTSFDNSSPDRFYPKYTEPQLIPKDAVQMRIITYKGKQPAGRLMTIKVDDLKKRAK